MKKTILFTFSLFTSMASISQVVNQDFETTPINSTNSPLSWKVYKADLNETFSGSNSKHQGTFYQGSTINNFNDSPNKFYTMDGDKYFVIISPLISVPTSNKLFQFKATAIQNSTIDFSVYVSPTLFTNTQSIIQNATLLSSYTGNSFLGGINLWKTESYPQNIIPSGNNYFYFIQNKNLSNLLAIDDVKINGVIASSSVNVEEINKLKMKFLHYEGKIKIELEGLNVLKTTLFNVSGEVITMTTLNEVSILNLTRGLYVIHVETNEGVFIEKIVL